jgi:NADPH:quinone reductase-like Zn-dependent oxidoreductase
VELATAAALPEVVSTVWSNVFLLAGLRRGDTFLVHGGSSGIGTMAIQLAARAGARVLTTAGTAAKLDVCRELGAEVLINYRDEDFVARVKEETDGAGVNVVLDNMGAKYLGRNVDALAVGGRLVCIGMQGGTKAELDLGTLMRKRASVHATTLRARPATGPGSKAEIVAAVLHDVWPDVERGVVRPIVDRRLPMSRVAEAHAVVEASQHIGKVLLLPED